MLENVGVGNCGTVGEGVTVGIGVVWTVGFTGVPGVIQGLTVGVGPVGTSVGFVPGVVGPIIAVTIGSFGAG